VQITRSSNEACRVLGRQSASLIFIDGDHSYDQVLADFNNYRDLLAPGGCMVFHDYGFGSHNGLPDTDPGVRPAIDEHVIGAEGFRPLLLAHTQFAFVKSDIR
jgi:cephalosporin hydroxylase